MSSRENDYTPEEKAMLNESFKPSPLDEKRIDETLAKTAAGQRPTLYSAVDPVSGVRFWEWRGKPGRVELHNGRYYLARLRGLLNRVSYANRTSATDALWSIVK